MDKSEILPTLADVTPERVEQKKMLLGQVLMNARKHRFKSALAASEALGVGQSTYLSYENGARQSVLAWWLVAAERVFAPRFGVDVSYLLGLREPQERNDAPLWLLNAMAPHLKSGDETLQLPITDDAMAPHLLNGDIAIFEKAGEVSQGGIYAIEYPNCQIYARWVMPCSVGGWQIKDANGVQESLSDQDISKLNIRGKYLFRLSK